MALDVPTMITELQAYVGQDTSELPQANALLLLNQSWWEIIDKFQFREKEFTATFATTAGTRNYEVPQPFEALRQVSITDSSDSQHIKLLRMIPNVYENVYNEDSSQQDIPTQYVREGCMIRLWPTPDQAYTITLKYMSVLPDLSTTNYTIPTVPQVWGECILYGAVWRQYARLGDLTRSAFFKNLQVGLINSTSPVETKEEYDSKESGLNAMRSNGRRYGYYPSYGRY
jgi:hypothetical protein